MIGLHHHLSYEQTTNNAGMAGLLAVCECGDFRAWLEGIDVGTELALLNIHGLHVKMESDAFDAFDAVSS